MGLAAFNRMRRRQAEMAEAAALEENKGEDLGDQGDQDPGKTDPGDQGDKDPGKTDPGSTDPGDQDPDKKDEDPGNTDPGNTDPIVYDDLSYDELKDIAKERGIPYASVKKVDLIEALKASK